VKNTFLEVIPITEEKRSRSKSCPIIPVRANCGAKELVLTEPSRAGNKELDADEDIELPTSWSRQGCTNGREQFSVDGFVPVDHIEASKSSADEPAPEDQSQVKKGRPCKKKRNRYKKLVHRLQTKISENPEVFTMDEVVLPPSLQANGSQRLKLIGRLERYQHKLLTSSGG